MIRSPTRIPSHTTSWEIAFLSSLLCSSKLGFFCCCWGFGEGGAFFLPALTTRIWHNASARRCVGSSAAVTPRLRPLLRAEHRAPLPTHPKPSPPPPSPIYAPTGVQLRVQYFDIKRRCKHIRRRLERRSFQFSISVRSSSCIIISFSPHSICRGALLSVIVLSVISPVRINNTWRFSCIPPERCWYRYTAQFISSASVREKEERGKKTKHTHTKKPIRRT